MTIHAILIYSTSIVLHSHLSHICTLFKFHYIHPHTTTDQVPSHHSPTTISKISITCPLSLNGIGLLLQYLSLRLPSANLANFSLPTPTSPNDLGIPNSRKTASSTSPKSLSSLLTPLLSKTSLTASSPHNTSSTFLCLVSLTDLLNRTTAGKSTQLVSPCPTPSGPSWCPMP